MKTKDLYLEYARVIKMCEGTKVKPWECVRCEGGDYEEHPWFNLDPSEYTFAVGIVEDKAVFVGDKLWSLIINRYVEIRVGVVINEHYVWDEPKRTFIVDDVESNCPSKDRTEYISEIPGYGNFYWGSLKDHDAFRFALSALLTEARDK